MMSKKDPFASCGNCLHMYWSFERKARFCRKAYHGDSLHLYDWCPDWERDIIKTSESLSEDSRDTKKLGKNHTLENPK